MGASEFFASGLIRPGATDEETFLETRENEAYLHGHGGYTGSLAEKREYVMRSEVVFDSETEAMDFAHNDLFRGKDHHHKWGPAWAIKYRSGDMTAILFYGLASS